MKEEGYGSKMEITVRLKLWMKLGFSPQYIEIVPRRHLVQLIISTLACGTPHKSFHFHREKI